MNKFDIYMIGVGGQGIGLLSETLIRAADYARLSVKGVDTHGLAQRGGTVVSHLRLGSQIYSPLIQRGKADMVIALERNEAMRGITTYLKENGVLVYYDVSWQPLDARLGWAKDTTRSEVEKRCIQDNIKVIRVFKDDLEDSRMQNVVVMAEIINKRLINDILADHIRKALQDLMQGSLLEKNLNLFNSICSPEH